MAALRAAKQALRKEIKRRVSALSAEEKRRQSVVVSQQVRAQEAVSSASYQQAANLMKPGHVLTPSLNGLNANSSPSKRLVPAVQCARCTHRVQGSSPSDRQPSSPAAAPRLTEKQPPEKQRNSLQTNTEKQPPEKQPPDKQPPTACSPKTHGKLAPSYSVVPAYCRYYGNAIKAPTNERN